MKRRPDTGHHAVTKKRPGAADEDVAHFMRAMADVVRVAPDPRGRVRAAPTARRAEAEGGRLPPRATHAASLKAGASRPAALDVNDAADAGFAAPGVDRRELRKLKRGEHPPGDRLDLHGMTAADAVERATRFIDRARGRHRCVAIVHGRGLHSAGQVSILRTRVRECLRQHRGVLAYADAPRGDGGSGAVYVLVRR